MAEFMYADGENILKRVAGGAQTEFIFLGFEKSFPSRQFPMAGV